MMRRWRGGDLRSLSLLCYLLASCKTGSSELGSSFQNPEQVSQRLKVKFPLPEESAQLPLHTKLEARKWAEQSLSVLLGTTANPLPKEHPATQVANQFVKRVHAGFVRAFPETKVPEPEAVVLDDDEINAFGASSAYCIPIPVVSESSAEQGAWIGTLNGTLVPSIMVQMALASAESVTQCPDWAQQKPELIPNLVQAIQEKNPACEAALVDGKIRLKHECLELLNEGKSSPGVMVAAAGASVFVFSGLMKHFDEVHFQATLAHELAHYYLAHSLATAEENLGAGEQRIVRKSYAFRIQDYGDRKHKPPLSNDPEIAEMQSLLAQTSDLQLEPKIAGARWHIKTLTYLARIYEQYHQLSEAIPEVIPFSIQRSCDDFRKKRQAFEKIFGTLETSYPQYAQYQPNYLKVERAGFQCLQSLEAKSPASLAVAAGAKGKEKEYARFAAIMRGMADLPKDSVLGAWTELVVKIDASEDEFHKKWSDVVQRARSLGFGMSTIETEADEMAAYLLTLAGKDPRAAIGKFFRQMAIREASADSLRGLQPTLSECRKGYLNGWEHWVFKGQPWIPYFGATVDPHPADCYRAYQIDMETRELGFVGPIALTASSNAYIDAVNLLRSQSPQNSVSP